MRDTAVVILIAVCTTVQVCKYVQMYSTYIYDDYPKKVKKANNYKNVRTK